MLEFFEAAWTWIALGMGVAIVMSYKTKDLKKKNKSK